MWWHGLRSRATAADTAVAVILALIAAVLSAALAFALSIITHVGLGDGTEEAVHMALMVTLWMFGFLAVVMPLFFGAGQPQVPLRRLLVFPLSRWQLYRVSLAASFASGVHLFWYPILTAITVVAIVFNDAPAFYWLAVVALFAVCLVVWCNTVLTIVQWVLRKRNVRELAVLIGLVLVVIVSMLPAMYQERAEERGEEWFGDLMPRSVTSFVGRVSSVFPPSLAVRALEAAVLGQPRTGLAPLLWLVLWTAGGGAIGYAIVRRFLLEGDQATQVHSAAAAPAAGDARWWSVERLTVFPVEVQAEHHRQVQHRHHADLRCRDGADRGSRSRSFVPRPRPREPGLRRTHDLRLDVRQQLLLQCLRLGGSGRADLLPESGRSGEDRAR
jgi:hypothetical protein